MSRRYASLRDAYNTLALTMEYPESSSNSLGAIGMGLGMYWYYRRPTSLAISIVVTVSVFALYLSNMLPYLWLATSGTSGSAKVIEVYCQQGQKHHIRYQFSAGSAIVDELGPDGYGNPTCEVIKVGDLAACHILTQYA